MLFAFVVGGLGFEFCVFVAGWRHALRSEWPFIIIIIITVKPQFKYVGSIVQADGGQDRELQRLCSAGQVFRSLKANLFSSRRVGLGAKLKFYKSLVLPRLMYGAAESWALTEAQGAQLETFHNGCLRQMMGLHRGPDGPSTAELLARTGQANMADHMRRHRVR